MLHKRAVRVGVGQTHRPYVVEVVIAEKFAELSVTIGHVTIRYINEKTCYTVLNDLFYEVISGQRTFTPPLMHKPCASGAGWISR